ncbi:MAG: hypothetical protein AB7F53_03250 [Nitrososphaeraceae archaeon]
MQDLQTQRGLEIANKTNHVLRINDYSYKVKSQSTKTIYYDIVVMSGLKENKYTPILKVYQI